MAEAAQRPVERAADLRGALRAYVARRVEESAVDDVVQEVFLRLVRAETHPADPRAWVYAVARSAVADHHRRGASRAARTAALAAEPDAAEPEAAEPGDAKDEAEAPRARAILAAWLAVEVDRLPEPYAETLRLTELEGLPHAEVAERLGVARGTVKARVSRGRRLLRGRLDECCRVELDARHAVVDLEPRSGCC